MNGFAEVVTTDLVLRSAPGTGPDSEVYGTIEHVPAYVVDGPVLADGYEWWLVAHIRFDQLGGPPAGWVAARGQDGEVWLAPTRLTCPDPPTREAAWFEPSMMVSCYTGVEIALAGAFSWDARIQSGGPGIMCVISTPVPPEQTPAACEQISDNRAVPMHFESVPAQSRGRIIATGHFDDPAAEGCVVEGDPLWGLHAFYCRGHFVGHIIQLHGLSHSRPSLLSWQGGSVRRENSRLPYARLMPRRGIERLRYFEKFVTDLGARHDLSEMSTSLEVNYDQATGLSARVEKPDEHRYRSFLIDARRLFTTGEDTHLDGILAIAPKHLPDATARKAITDAAEHYRQIRVQGEPRVIVNEQEMRPAELANLLIQGTVFHGDERKLLRLKDLISGDPITAALIRGPGPPVCDCRSHDCLLGGERHPARGPRR